MKKGHHPGASSPISRLAWVARTAAVTGTPEYRRCKEECLARIRAEVRSSFGAP
jgi:hypothetical protein